MNDLESEDYAYGYKAGRESYFIAFDTWWGFGFMYLISTFLVRGFENLMGWN